LSDTNNNDNHSTIDRLTARFSDKQLEARFLDERAERDLRLLRNATLLGILVNLGFAVLDYIVITEHLALALAIRLTWALPASSLAFAMTFVPFYKKRLGLLGWTVILASTLFYAAINAVSNTPDVYLSGFIIILFIAQILLPLSFPTTLGISVSCTVIFAALIPLTREVPIGHLLTIYSQFLATLVAGNFAVYLINYFRRQEFLSGQKVFLQRKRYFDLLTRILPQSIVTRMEGGETHIVDNVPSAAVLFADIVAFTETAARHPPGDVIDSLNALFKRFDDLVARHSVEKIKTIGDAYMVAAGVTGPGSGNLNAIAELALDMLDAADASLGPDQEPMRIRVGIHTGPLIAGVIGESRFGYDLWGDTVNVASRMQTLSEPGRVQVSEAVYRELADDYDWESGGTIEVKGKGQADVWFLIGRKQ